MDSDAAPARRPYAAPLRNASAPLEEGAAVHRVPIRPSAGLLVMIAAAACAAAAPVTASPAGDLAGSWGGVLVHGGDSTSMALEFERAGGDTLHLRVSLPVIHLDRVPLGRFVPAARGDSILCGPFRLALDPRAGRLGGTMPAALVPVYTVPFELRRVEGFETPARAPLEGPVRRPRWTYEAGAPIWAGTRVAGGTVYAGDTSGTVHALDAATGERRWTFRAAGPVRVRPTVAGGAVWFQADDGYLYRVRAADGTLEWKRRIIESRIERLPFHDPKSRYDRFGADVVVWEDLLFAGTHEGVMLALDRDTGTERWSFRAGDAILAAPAVAGGVLVFGGYDGRVYALDARTGGLRWSHDAKAPVVSTPAIHDGAAIVGTRGYDLLALALHDGALRWKRYVWMSWVESSPIIAAGTAYVGSSDAAALFAFDAASGRRNWKTDVHGWAWGQPAVAGDRLYAGTSGQVGYPAAHRAEVLALDRASGAVLWRFAADAPESGAFGFPGSVSVGHGGVFAAGLDGRVYAFDE